ncbi:hypothetical protein AeNC1_000451 [Aphanomyces euteiches]|nr:hypothetical protein AeNC1_000451 [Aphanomyces euteiches]
MVDDEALDDEVKQPSNAYLEHFLHIIQATKAHYETLLSPEEIIAIDTFVDMSEAAQTIYARLFQRKGPWFRTISLDAIANSLPNPQDLQPSLQTLADHSFIRLCPDDSFHKALEAMEVACTIPEIQAIMFAIGASTSKSNARYKTKADMLERLRSYVSTQRRIDGSYLPLAKHLHGALRGKDTPSDEIVIFQIEAPTRDAFFRMHRLMYVTPLPPPRSAPPRIPSWHDWRRLAVKYDPIPWPGLLQTFGKVSFQAVEHAKSTILPNIKALVAYECAGMLRRAFGLLVESLAVDDVAIAHSELTVEWLDMKPPSLLAFLSTNSSKMECYASVQSFIESVPDLDAFVAEVRSCMHESNERQADPRVFLEPFHATYGLARCLDKAIALYEKRSQYDKALILLRELLSTKVLRHKRGSWYTRLAINLELHMKQPAEALAVCNEALSDPSVFPTDRKAISRRLARLTKTASQDDDGSGWASLTIDGRPLNRAMGEKSRFIGYDDAGCSVEEFVLQHFQREGWYGTHHEGSQLLMLLGLFLWDIIFMDVPHVFQTPFQDRPLDMDMRFADHFYTARAPAIETAIAKLEECTVNQLCEWLQTTWNDNLGKQCGLVYWDTFNLAYMQLMAVGLGAKALSQLMRIWLKHLDTSGLPDLFMLRVSWQGDPNIQVPLDEQGYVNIPTWNSIEEQAHIDVLIAHSTVEAQFVEVKGPRDRLSDTQMVWLERLNASGIKAMVCHVQEPSKAEKSSKRPRERQKATASKHTKVQASHVEVIELSD